MSIVFLYLDKNFQFTGFDKGMADNNNYFESTQSELKVKYADEGVVVLDSEENYFDLTQSEEYTKISRHTLRSMCKDGRIKDWKKGKTRYGEQIFIHKNILEQLKVNPELTQSELKVNQGNDELINHLELTLSELKEQLKVKDKQLENKDEQIKDLTQTLSNQQTLTLQTNKILLELQKEKQTLLEQKNQPKKGWRSWFGGE